MSHFYPISPTTNHKVYVIKKSYSSQRRSFKIWASTCPRSCGGNMELHGAIYLDEIIGL